MEQLSINDLITTNEDPEEVFELIELLGEGSYGSVYKAIHKSSSTAVAIKIFPSSADLTSIQLEVSIMKQCRSPSIVAFYGSYVKNGSLWLIMELCAVGSVQDLMKAKRTLNEEEIAAVLLSVLKGLDYLHERGVVHRDVKAGNILLDHRGNAKLGDFGVSAPLGLTSNTPEGIVGSPYWMSPEVISNSQHDNKTDIWSLGITAIELAEGQPPLSHIHHLRAMFVIKNRPPRGLTDPSKWSSDFASFVESCLNVNPQERPTTKELLSHPFVSRSRGKVILMELVTKEFDRVQAYRLGKRSQEDAECQQPSERVTPKRDEADEVCEFNDLGTVVVHENTGQRSLTPFMKYFQPEGARVIQSPSLSIIEEQLNKLRREMQEELQRMRKQCEESIINVCERANAAIRQKEQMMPKVEIHKLKHELEMNSPKWIGNPGTRSRQDKHSAILSADHFEERDLKISAGQQRNANTHCQDRPVPFQSPLMSLASHSTTTSKGVDLPTLPSIGVKPSQKTPI
eukprot:TRINITY_DN15424_c0_g1_i2.p1 TRINITY_DN15424_c0_g1~~TRINITY_DN15424_c0_g1_i2.p1  ORF type:complete len:513 (-),score=63.97 TRINITY_DN15424_c0_g1_i2:110-1648(-)